MKLPPSVDPAHVSHSSAPPTEQSVVVALRPLGNIADSTSIEFNTGKHSDVVIDPQSIQLNIKIKVTDDKNVALAALTGKQHMCAANGMLNSFFSAITVKANNQQVYYSHHHNYVSYLTTILNTTSDYRSSVLRASGWFETGGVIDVASLAAKDFIKVFDGSKEVILAGKLECPFFQSSKFLPVGTELGISLTRAPTEVFLVTDITTGIKLHLLEAELTLRYIRLEPPLLAAIGELASKPYLYPYRHVETRAITLPSGIANYAVQNLHIGRIPSLVIFTLIASTDYKGLLSRSPYIFTPAGLNGFFFSLNGVKIPVRELKFDCGSVDGIVPLYNYVNEQLGISTQGASPNLTIAKYQEQNMFFVAQNLKRDVSSSSLSSPARGGSLSLELSLKTALTASHTLLIFSEFSRSIVSFNPDGTVTAQQ